METLEEIINNNIEHLKKAKEMSINKGHEDLANETQINVFPNLNADEREFLMTGYTPDDWDAMLGWRNR
jgi:hypothetical protein